MGGLPDGGRAPPGAEWTNHAPLRNEWPCVIQRPAFLLHVACAEFLALPLMDIKRVLGANRASLTPWLR